MDKFLAQYRVDEIYMEAAYSGLPHQTKGWLKKTIALSRSINAGALFEWECCSRKNDGMCLELSSRPAGHLLVLYPAAYPAAVRAAAAVVPSLFFGVKSIWAVAVSDEVKKFNYSREFSHAAAERYPEAGFNFNLLGTWELAGVEDVFCLPEQKLDILLEKLKKHCPEFRVIVLGHPAWSDKLVALEQKLSCRIWYEPQISQISVQQDLKQCFKIIKNIHPDLKVKAVPEPEPDAVVVVGSREFCKKAERAKLCLDAAYAGCWSWPELAPVFFLTRSVAVEQTALTE